MSFVSEIKSAKEISQAARITRDDESWYSKYFVRYFSIYISYALVQLRISANFVTVFGGVVGLCGSFCMVFHNLWWNLVGAVLWQLWFVLDCVDGEVARLHRRSSALGIYLDRLSHIIVNSTFVLAFGLHVYFLEPSALHLIASIAIYSAWHWKREIWHLVNATMVVDAGFKKGDFVSNDIKRRKSIILIMRILNYLVRDIEAMLVVSIIIIVSHELGFDFARWSLYFYTIVVLAYVGRLILRYSKQISKKAPDI